MANDVKDKDQAPAEPSATTGSDSSSGAEQATEQAFFDAGEAAGEAGVGEEVDPELLKLPRPKRKRRHPVISLIVIGLAVYLMVFLRQDIGFFLEPAEPVVLGEASAAVEADKLRHNSYIKLEGTPDRKNALIIESRVGGFDSFFRLLGTSNRVFVQKHREHRASDEDIGTVHAGQLVRFDSLPYAESLQSYLAKRMTTAHDLSFKAIKAALAQGMGKGTVKLKDVKGEAVTLTPDSMIWINAAHPNEWVIQFSKHAYATAELAQQELNKRLEGLSIPTLMEDEASKIFWRFVALAEPDQFAQLRARFKVEMVGGRPRYGVVRRQVSYSARLNQLKVDDGALVIDAADPSFPSRYLARADSDAGAAPTLAAVKERRPRLPASSILFISTSTPFSVPTNAMVLMMDRAPGDNWYYLLLYLVLVAFVGLNVVTLALRLRSRD